MATRKPITLAEIRAQIPAAQAWEEAERRAGRRAVTARYDRPHRRLVIELSNGGVVGVPVAGLDALRGMSDAQLARVTLSPTGGGLRWDAEDIDLSVSGIILALVDDATGMQLLARRGGRSTSSAKAAAARANGAKGGRPRKTKAA